MKKSIVYTRTGDSGTTSLVGGTRVAKTHPRLEAYGCIDELNSQLGMLLALLPPAAQSDGTSQSLYRIQNTLFSVGALLATGEEREPAPFAPDATAWLEGEIDRVDAALPPLTAFVLPGGNPAAACCHVCRTVCRRAERRILALSGECRVDAGLLAYVNRLSDFLFVLARHLNKIQGTAEFFWEK